MTCLEDDRPLLHVNVKLSWLEDTPERSRYALDLAFESWFALFVLYLLLLLGSIRLHIWLVALTA